MKQEEQILFWCKHHKGITSAEAWYNLGIAHLPRRIADLEEKGHTVTKITEHGTNKHTGNPTQKPLSLLKQLITLFTDKGDVVVDPCAGSGSTLLAAEELGRKAYGFEIKKEFCDMFEKTISQNVEPELGLE